MMRLIIYIYIFEQFMDEISIYESEINSLTDKLNETQNLEFLVQNSSQTNKWRREADAYASTSQSIYNDFMIRKKDLRYKQEQEKFEASRLTEFKINSIIKTKEEAIKLYQEVIIVHFYDFYLKFEKWMSDLIKLHNDIMSVHQKLVECEKALNTPVEFQRIDSMIDTRIANVLELMSVKKTLTQNVEHTPILTSSQLHNHHYSNVRSAAYSPVTPPQTMCSSKNSSIEMARNSSSSTRLDAARDDVATELHKMLNYKYVQTNIDTVLTR